MIITSIQQAKKNEERVNIFLDGEFWVGLNKNELLEFGLHKDKTISEEEKRDIENASTKGKIKNRVMNYIILRPHSRREIRDHFKVKPDIQIEVLDNVLQKLEDQGLISDLNFAKWYLENRLSSGKHGINKIKAELMKKGVSNKFIEIAIFEKSGSEDFEEKQTEQLKTYIEKVKKSIKAKDDREFKNKLIQRLLSRGFKYDDIKKALRVTDDE